jgi:hypothetical protein
MTEPSRTIALPEFALRALHSGLHDWLYAIGEDPLARSFAERLGGPTFDHFLDAMDRNAYRVSATIDPDGHVAHLGVTLPVESGDRQMFTMPTSVHGLTAEMLMKSGTRDLDADLDSLLGGDE